ncbi:MAG: SurA N-terminal domain-containing protein [Pseudomonadota bacterium]
MIEIIRKRLNSVFVLLLLGLLIASFAFFGIGDVVQVGQGDTIAKVGDRRITLVELARSFEGFVERQRAENPEITAAAAIRSNVDLAILQQLVQQAVVSEAANETGIAASPRRTKAMIASLPTFQLAGKFDQSTYQSALARLGITEEQLVEDMAQQQVIDQMETVLRGAAVVPDALAQAQLSVMLETRTADAILVPFSNFEETIDAPDTEALEKFFETIRGRYTAPEYRDFTALYLNPEVVAKDITVSEEDLQQAFDYRKGEFGDPASVDLQLMVFDTKEEADSFKAKAVNGALFLELAQQAGTSLQDLSLGRFTKEEAQSLYEDNIAEALFALDTGDVSEPLEGPFGYQVFRIAGKTEETLKTFEDVKEELEKDIALELALDRLSDIGNSIEDEFAAGATLEEAAVTFGLTPEVYTLVSDTGVTADDELAARQSDLQSILPRVFDYPEDNELEVERLGDDGFFIARVDKITPRRPRRLDEVQSEVEAAWREDQLDSLALDAAEEVSQKLSDGANVQVLASTSGYEALTGISFNRAQAQQGSLAQADLAPLLFAMEPGQVDVGRSGSGDAYVVVKLLKKEAGDASATPALARQLQTQIGDLVEQELLQQFITGRSEALDRTTNKRALETFRRRYDPTL